MHRRDKGYERFPSQPHPQPFSSRCPGGGDKNYIETVSAVYEDFNFIQAVCRRVAARCNNFFASRDAEVALIAKDFLRICPSVCSAIFRNIADLIALVHSEPYNEIKHCYSY